MVAPMTQSDALCMNIDFAPTLLEAAGVHIPAAMQGRSLMPLLRGEKPADWRKEVFYAYWAKPPHYGIRTERYKLIHVPQAGAWELLDLEKDPDEMRNLINHPQYKTIAADLKNRLEMLTSEIGLEAAGLPPHDPFAPDGKARDGNKAFHESMVARFAEQNKAVTPGGIVFVGDSITQGLPTHALGRRRTRIQPRHQRRQDRGLLLRGPRPYA